MIKKGKMKKQIQIDELFTISDLETLKVVSDPLRMRMIEDIGLANDRGQLRTVKQLAEVLDTPPPKLYYHINLLEKNGLIRVAETKIVSGIIEKHYQCTARRIAVSREIFEGETTRDEQYKATIAMLDGALDATRIDFVNLVEAIGTDEEIRTKLHGQRGHLTRNLARMSYKQAAAFQERLMDLVKEFETIEPDNDGEDVHVYSFLAVFIPTHKKQAEAPQVQIQDNEIQI